MNDTRFKIRHIFRARPIISQQPSQKYQAQRSVKRNTFIKNILHLSKEKVLFLYVMDNHSFHPPFYGTYCAGEVCFSRTDGKKVSLIMASTMVVDLDHFLANPVFDPCDAVSASIPSILIMLSPLIY